MGSLGFHGLDDGPRVTEDPSASFRLIAMKATVWIVALLTTTTVRLHRGHGGGLPGLKAP